MRLGRTRQAELDVGGGIGRIGHCAHIGRLQDHRIGDAVGFLDHDPVARKTHLLLNETREEVYGNVDGKVEHADRIGGAFDQAAAHHTGQIRTWGGGL
jgi:hypothetical protein